MAELEVVVATKQQRIEALLTDFTPEEIEIVSAENKLRYFRATEAAKAPPLPAEMTPEQWAALQAYVLDGSGHMDGHRAILEMLASLNDGKQADFWLGCLIHAKVGMRLDPTIKAPEAAPIEAPITEAAV